MEAGSMEGGAGFSWWIHVLCVKERLAPHASSSSILLSQITRHESNAFQHRRRGGPHPNRRVHGAALMALHPATVALLLAMRPSSNRFDSLGPGEEKICLLRYGSADFEAGGIS